MSVLFPSHSKITVDATGIHVSDGDDSVADARTRFINRLADAWRGPDRATTQTLDHIKRKREISQAWRGGDAGGPYGATPSKPDAAYAARSERLASAWQNVAAAGPTPRAPKASDPPWLKLQKRKYKPGLPEYDSAGGHDGDTRTARPVVEGADDATTMFDDDAQAARDEANAAYVDRICNAWKEPK